MTRFVPLFVLCLATPPAAAQEGDMRDGMDLLSQGTQLLLRGLLQEIEPALREIEPRLRELQPFLRELEAMLPDVQLYDLPEVLPNGDIIIRRKIDPEVPDPPTPDAEGEIEL